jgi:hypothetical protein
MVPLLLVWSLRRLPRRPPSPVSEEELRRLASRLQPIPSSAVADDSPTGNAPRSKDDQNPLATVPISTILLEKTPLPQLKNSSYWSFSIISVPIWIATCLACVGGFYLLFDYLGEQRARSFTPAVYLFKPFSYGIICILPAFLVGTLASYPFAMGIFRLFFGPRLLREWLFWDEGRIGSRNVDGLLGAASMLSLFCSVLCTLFVLLVMNWYARFADDEIGIKRFFAVSEEVYPYGDIEQIVVSSHRRGDNGIERGEDLGIRFRDGRIWDTDGTFHMPSGVGERDRLLEFLQWKTGKPIVRVRLLSDAPGW